MDTESEAHVHDGMLLASQKEISSPAAAWMNLKSAVLLRIGQAPQNKPHMIPHTHGGFQSRRNSEAKSREAVPRVWRCWLKVMTYHWEQEEARKTHRTAWNPDK